MAVPAGMGPEEFFRVLGPVDVPLYVEVPRDDRRPAMIAAIAARGPPREVPHRRRQGQHVPEPGGAGRRDQGGDGGRRPVQGDGGAAPPVRNTDPETGFHQHGFLNLLLATDAALDGRPLGDLAAILADRDAPAVARRVARLGEARTAAARALFLSFGTCSITDPVTELADLGLLESVLQETTR